MTETKPAYTNGHSNGNGSAPTIDASELVPSAWLRFLYRCAGLKRGKVYQMVLFVPERAADPIMWTILGEGKIEDGMR